MQKTNEREATKYYELVARRGDEYIMLDETFKYGDGFHGATGSTFRLVSREEYEERTSPEAIRDSYEYIWREQAGRGDTELGLTEWLEQIDPDEIFDDTQYADLVRERAGVSEEDYPIVECVGGGRCFSVGDEYDEVFRPDLLDVIKQAEAGN